MKRTRIFIMSLALSFALVPINHAHAQETENPFKVGNDTYANFDEALAAARKNRTKPIELIANVTLDKGITITSYDTITLNLGNYTITTSPTFSGDFITNNGNLTITGDSDGLIDLTKSPNSKNGVYNLGYVHMSGGTMKNVGEHVSGGINNQKTGRALLEGTTKLEGFATNVLTTASAETTITGGTYENYYMTNIDNVGKTTITGGTFISHSCSACYKEWGYTIRNRGGHLEIDGQDINVYGVQGALAVVSGTANVRNGHFETKACPNHPNGSTAFYALYVAGELAETTTNIYGGEFISVSKTAAVVGNSKGDGGKQANSNCYIHGGKFTTNGGNDVAVVTADTNGNAFIDGGSFNKMLPDAFINNGYQQSLDVNSGYYIVMK